MLSLTQVCWRRDYRDVAEIQSVEDRGIEYLGRETLTSSFYRRKDVRPGI